MTDDTSGTDDTTNRDAGTGDTTDAPGGVADTVLDDLFAVIESRQAELPDGSYTTSLFLNEKGENAVLEKLGEEATETILAAKDDDDDAVVAEAADLVYHLLVVLAMHDRDLDDLRAELADR